MNFATNGIICSELIENKCSAGNKAGNVPFINFKGYMLGNTFTNLNRNKNEGVPYAHRMGLISDELYESMKISCGGQYVNVDPSNTVCVKNLKTYFQCISRINVIHILEPECDITALKAKEMEKYRRSLGDNFQESVDLKSSLPLEPQSSYPGCREYGYLLSNYWANDDRVQMVLNVTKGTISKWARCYNLKPYQFEIESTFPYLVRLSKRGYHSLVYSGDHDMGVPFSSTEAWIRDLNYPIIDDWQPWFVDGQVGGEPVTRLQSTNLRNALKCLRAFQGMQSQQCNERKLLPTSLPKSMPYLPQQQQVPSHSLQNTIASAGVQSTSLPSPLSYGTSLMDTTVSNGAGQSCNMLQSLTGYSTGQCVPSNIFASSEKMQVRQHANPMVAQQQSQNAQQFICSQQLQNQIAKQMQYGASIIQPQINHNYQQTIQQTSQLQSSQLSFVQAPPSLSSTQPSLHQTTRSFAQSSADYVHQQKSADFGSVESKRTSAKFTVHQATTG